MSFVEALTLKFKNIMEQSYKEPFLKEIGEGTLSDEKFKDYIIQDSIYLRYYVKTYAYGLAKSPTIKEMKMFYSMVGYVDDSENLTRLDYLRGFGMNDNDIDMIPKKIQCHQYCEFLEENAKKGDIADIIVAGLPCMVGYRYVFAQLKKDYPEVMNGKYAPMVNDYTSESYNEFCDRWISFAGSVIEPLDDIKKKKLEEIYGQAMLHELYFWQMASGTKEEP